MPAVSNGSIPVLPHNEKNRVEAKEPVLQTLRQLIERNGSAVIDDLRRYWLLCLKAEELRKSGFRARVRGRRRCWLIVIERAPQRSEDFPTPHPRRPAAFMRRGQVHRADFQRKFHNSSRPLRERPQRLSLVVRRTVPLPWFV
jgi:hypothetical protein